MENIPQPKIYEKDIQITNISNRVINYTSKKTGQPATGTIFQIFANDGLTYETWDSKWASQRKIGEVLKIKYEVRTSTSRDGRVFTNYSLVLPKSDFSNRILERLDLLEKNILAKLDMYRQTMSGSDSRSEFDKPKNAMPTINVDLPENANENEEVETTDDDLPF